MRSKLIKTVALVLTVLFLFVAPAAYAEEIVDIDMVSSVKVSLGAASNSGVSLKWTRSEQAIGYSILRAGSSDGAYKTIAEVDADCLSYEDTTALRNRVYYYKVGVIVNAINGEVIANKSAAVSGYKRNSAPTLSVKGALNRAVLSWSGIIGATGYQVFTSQSENGKYNFVKNVSGKSCYVKAEPGKTYYYKVRSYVQVGNTKYYGLLSAPVYAKTYTEASSVNSAYATKLTPCNASNSYVELAWSEVNGASEYYVYRAASKNGTYKRIARVASAGYKDTSALRNQRYYYKICTIVGTGSSAIKAAYSNVISGYKRNSAPSSLEANGAYNKVILNWKGVSGVDGYQIFSCTTKDGEYNYIKSTDDKWCEVRAKGGKQFYFKVRSYVVRDGVKYYGLLSEPVAATAVKLDPNKPVIAITYDDGPGGASTTRILNTLEKYGCRATFFMVGNTLSESGDGDKLRRMRNNGMELANHSWSHPLLTSLSSAEVSSQFNKTNNKINSICGVTPEVARPPYGGVNSRVLDAMGMPAIQWSIDTLDWQSHNPSSIYSKCMNAKDGDIILMHDIHTTTATATEMVIPALVKKGYQIVTVSELAEYKGVELKDGKTYFSIR